jgi:hypothetical protein
VGTRAAFGFVVAYLPITVAAPVYFKDLGELHAKDVIGCVLSVALQRAHRRFE